MTIADFSYKEVYEGQVFEITKKLSRSDIDAFISLTGNKQPLHCEDDFALKTEFKGVIAHGLHVSSYISALFGMVCPGKHCLCLSQNLEFKRPVYEAVVSEFNKLSQSLASGDNI